MRRKLSYTAEAHADLNSIIRYISEQSGSREVGREFGTKLREQCRKLADLPGILGTARPELVGDIRSTPFRGYVIFFHYRGNVVEIVALLEGGRDVQAYFDD